MRKQVKVSKTPRGFALIESLANATRVMHKLRL